MYKYDYKTYCSGSLDNKDIILTSVSLTNTDNMSQEEIASLYIKKLEIHIANLIKQKEKGLLKFETPEFKNIC